jgi:hypothetical protein
LTINLGWLTSSFCFPRFLWPSTEREKDKNERTDARSDQGSSQDDITSQHHHDKR